MTASTKKTSKKTTTDTTTDTTGSSVESQRREIIILEEPANHVVLSNLKYTPGEVFTMVFINGCLYIPGVQYLESVDENGNNRIDFGFALNTNHNIMVVLA